MESMNCLQCGTGMVESSVGAASVQQCPDGHGIFLARPQLGALVEAETDWHRYAGQHTAPMPRITPDMEAAPPPVKPPARAWIETLF